MTITQSYPICQVCFKSFKIITNTHLKAHNHTFESYRSAFPNAILVNSSHKERLINRNKERKGSKVSQETKNAMSASHKGKKHSQETKDKIGKANKGKTLSEEHKAALQQGYLAAVEANGGEWLNKGIKRTQDFKDKLGTIAKARSGKLVTDKLEAMWKARRGSKATPEQKERYRQARLTLMRDYPEKVGFVWKDTKPELEFEEELKKRNIEYSKQYHSSKPHYIFDFKSGNILFEIDGPYHHNPKVHSKIENFERQVERDRAKDEAAIKLGFQLFRIPVTNRLPDNWIEILKQQGCNLF